MVRSVAIRPSKINEHENARLTGQKFPEDEWKRSSDYMSTRVSLGKAVGSKGKVLS